MINFSDRIRFDCTPNPLACTLQEIRHQNSDVLDLTCSNPTKAGFEYPATQITDALSSSSCVYEPTSTGFAGAKNAICEYYRAKGISINPKQVVLTSSTSEAFSCLFRLLTNPGDQILTPQPCYPIFQYLASFDCVEISPYKLRYKSTWTLDIVSIEKAFNSSSKAILVVNPNNPTGTFLKKPEKNFLNEFCRKKNIPLIVDEVFLDYPMNAAKNDQESTCKENCNLTFTISGLSKVAGLPQMKLSWIVISGPTEIQEEARRKIEILMDMYLSVSAPIQEATPTFLESRGKIQQQIRMRAQRNLSLLKNCLAGTRALTLEVEGGWYGIIQLPDDRTDEEWALDILKDSRILFHPGYFYDFQEEAFLVCSLITPIEEFKEAIGRLKKYLLQA